MNVLITGGYGFIGSHVAKRFAREGHRIYIIDNLSTGSSNNVNFRHRFYNLNIEDHRCEEVFRSSRFDIVVHLAAHISVAKSIENPLLDARCNILGLANMLQLSAQYGVKKFIFASSAAVYGGNQYSAATEEDKTNPRSPYGMSKLTGELYCQKWQKIYGLNTLCLRFSNVYGPKQGIIGEGGVVSVFIERMLQGKELVIYGDGNQTRDFIYVEDIANAIYMAGKSNITGIFNLSTHTRNSVNELVRILESIHPVKTIVHRDPQQGDIRDSCLNNTKIKKALAWSPQYSLEQGLINTFEWHEYDYKQKSCCHTEKSKESPKTTAAKALLRLSTKFNVLPYVENIIMFMLVCVLTFISQNADALHLLDFKLIYIVIMGSVYGIRQAVLSSLMSCGLCAFLFMSSGRSIVSLIYDTGSLLQFAFYVLVGMVLGYVIESKNSSLKTKDELLQAFKDKHRLLNEVHEETLRIQEELYEQIINSSDSYGKVYSMLLQLDSLEPNGVFAGGISLLENIMKSDKVSMYSLADTKGIAILAAKSQQSEFVLPGMVKIKERADIQRVLDTKEVFINRELSPRLPIMTAPIMDREDVIAIASIHSTEFENLTLHRSNLFKVAVNLISLSLTHAYRYIEALQEEIHYTKPAKIERFKVRQTQREKEVL